MQDALDSASHLPIEETRDFKDPFSELNLFLAKRIRSSMQEYGTPSRWSSKIQGELMQKILPEFRQVFPRHHLAPSALKQTWNKIVNFYSSLNHHQEAFDPNGRVNVDYLIRENLRKVLSIADPMPSSGYLIAQQIAFQVGECLAALQAESPKLDELTELVWGVYQHLIPESAGKRSRQNGEVYTSHDKFIIKTLLERMSEDPSLTEEQLRHKIFEDLQGLAAFLDKTSQEELYVFTASILARKRYPFLSIAKDARIGHFIASQLALFAAPKELAPQIEITQRLLSVYPLTAHFPEQFDIVAIKGAIRFLYAATHDQEPGSCPMIDEILFTFLTTELNFLMRKGLDHDVAFVESVIIDTLCALKTLPHWHHKLLDELEIALWYFCSQTSAIGENPWIEAEIASLLISSPELPFALTVYKALDHFKKIQRLFREKPLDLHRIRHWTLQNDMLLRSIHFDAKAPLYQLALDFWQTQGFTEESVEHTAFIELLTKTFLHHLPHLLPFASIVKTHAWIIYKYLWYHAFTTPKETTFERFLLWHRRSNARGLNGTIRRLLPCMPLKY